MNDEEKQEDIQENQENENKKIENPEPDLQEKINSLEHDLAVMRADFYNYRQRAVKEKNETRKRSQEDVIIEILPVLDNLDRALSAAESEDTKSIITGVQMVQRQFINVLESLGVTVINSMEQTFDPSIHNASGTQTVEDEELDGKIINELLKGYRTKDRVLRPAQVIVGKKSD